MPFITVYTKPLGSGVDASGVADQSWYHSKMTYIFQNTPTANTSYCGFVNINNSPTPEHYAYNLVSMGQSPVNNPDGNYIPSQQIWFFVIGSNSASPVNSVEFVLQKMGIITSNSTTEMLFSFPIVPWVDGGAYSILNTLITQEIRLI